MTPEVPNAANFNMAAKPDQQRRADANEVMLEKRASRWGSDEVISRDRSQPPLGPEASTEGAEGLRGGGVEGRRREQESGESQWRSPPAVACVSEAATPGGYAAESA